MFDSTGTRIAVPRSTTARRPGGPSSRSCGCWSSGRSSSPLFGSAVVGVDVATATGADAEGSTGSPNGTPPARSTRPSTATVGRCSRSSSSDVGADVPLDRRSRSAQRLIEVGDQVVHVLDAHADPDEVVRGSRGGPGGGRVRHDAGVLDQRFDAAEALGQREDLCPFAQLDGRVSCRRPGGPRSCRRTAASAWPPRVARVGLEAGVDDLGHLRMVGEQRVRRLRRCCSAAPCGSPAS